MEGFKKHKYLVKKTNGKPMDPRSKHFVLRYDKHQDDKNHMRACQKAMLVYADTIEQHMPELAADLRKEVELNNK